MNDFLFVALAVIAAIGAISVVLCRKVVHMAASLIVALSAVAGLFFSMGATFVGTTQLMVYVGGTVILLIFGVMLTSMQAKAELKTTPIEAIVALASSVILLLIFAFTLGRIEWKQHYASLSANHLKVAQQKYRSASESLSALKAGQSEELAKVSKELADAKAAVEAAQVSKTALPKKSSPTEIKTANEQLVSAETAHSEAQAKVTELRLPIENAEFKVRVEGSELIASAQQIVTATKVQQSAAIKAANEELKTATAELVRVKADAEQSGNVEQQEKAVTDAQKKLIEAEEPVKAAEADLVAITSQIKGVPSGEAQASVVKLDEQPSAFKSLAFALAGIRTDSMAADSYLLPFEIISFHLLVVLVAAGYLARPRSKQSEHDLSAE